MKFSGLLPNPEPGLDADLQVGEEEEDEECMGISDMRFKKDNSRTAIHFLEEDGYYLCSRLLDVHPNHCTKDTELVTCNNCNHRLNFPGSGPWSGNVKNGKTA